MSGHPLSTIVPEGGHAYQTPVYRAPDRDDRQLYLPAFPHYLHVPAMEATENGLLVYLPEFHEHLLVVIE